MKKTKKIKTMGKVVDDGEWHDYPKNKPAKDSYVMTIIQHWNTKGTRKVALKYVDEDDCDFRFLDGFGELSYEWSVIKFSNQYDLSQIKQEE